MKGIRELNLESGYPAAAEALHRLEADMAAARSMHRPVMKIIHGYGSSGKGGRIRGAVRRYLKEQQEQGKVKAVIYGEDFSIFSEETRRAFTICEALRQDRDLDGCNQGISFVVL